MDPENSHKISLYGRVKAAFITLSATALTAIMVSSWLYQEIVYNEEKISLNHLVNVKYIELINDLEAMMTELGLGLQTDPDFRQAIKQNNFPKIDQYLNNEYHQYFVTAEMLSLQKIYLLNKNLQFSSASSEGNQQTSLSNPICHELAETAAKRKNAERLKSISMLCEFEGKSYLSLIVPVGTLAPVGYLQIVVDPVFNLKPIAQTLALELSIRSPDGEVNYRSKKWPTEKDISDFLFSDFTISNNHGEPIINIEIAKPIAEFKERSLRTVIVVLGITGILFLIVFFITFRILNRGFNALHELETGTQHISSGDYRPLPTSKYRELNSLIYSFNLMTKKIENSQASLEQEVKDATKDLNLALQDVAQKNRELETAMQLSEQANETKSTFLANMSHELRTPLNAIIGYGEILREDAEEKDETDTMQDLDKVLKAGKHLLNLVNEILDLSKVEAGKVGLFIEEFNLIRLVKEIYETAIPIAETNNNTINLHITSECLSLKSDEMRIKQILFNLISNACKFTKNGTIDITVKDYNDGENDEDGQYSISIKDTGIGIKDSELPGLFTAFTQADISTTKKYGGSGLGLALSKQLCDLLGAKIEVDSVFDEGSEFVILLPKKI